MIIIITFLYCLFYEIIIIIFKKLKCKTKLVKRVLYNFSVGNFNRYFTFCPPSKYCKIQEKSTVMKSLYCPSRVAVAGSDVVKPAQPPEERKDLSFTRYVSIRQKCVLPKRSLFHSYTRFLFGQQVRLVK